MTNTIIIWIIASITVVSLISFVGIFMLMLGKKIKIIIPFLVSLAVGGMLGGAFFHIIPESFEKIGNKTFTWITLGIIIFFILEKLLWHHHSHCAEKHHAKDMQKCIKIRPVGWIIIIGDGIHNLTDGFVIAAAYLVDFKLGIITTMAVILHEIPQELGDFGILIQSGFTIKKAFIWNFISSLAALLGGLIIIILGFTSHIETLSVILVSIAAGGFIYIATADLIPHLHEETSIKNSLIQLLGITIGLLALTLIK